MSTSQEKKRHKTISNMAYHLWEKDGCPTGMDKFYWYEAKKQWCQPTLEERRRLLELAQKFPDRDRDGYLITVAQGYNAHCLLWRQGIPRYDYGDVITFNRPEWRSMVGFD